MGTEEREKYEYELRMDILGRIIKNADKNEIELKDNWENLLVSKNHRFLNLKVVQIAQRLTQY